MSDLQPAIDFFGNKRRVAAALEVSAMRVQNWERRKVPIFWAIEIEKKSGGRVTREQIRPDIFG